MMKNETIREFSNALLGNVVTPEDNMYDDERQVWNGLIDKYPALIVKCRGTSDVILAVNFARENKLQVSIRGGGHNVAGLALVDDGLVIDLSDMRGVHVDPDKKTAIVEGGAIWADVDRETQLYGLAAPGGVVSTTGVAGLTLGGGLGRLRKKHGLSCDNLRSVRIVTAEGNVLTASEHENSDLFWAIRGGGGNFGVVTGFEFQLHEMNPEVYAGFIVFPFIQAKEIMRQYREFSKSAPEELNVWIVMRHAPPLPFLPQNIHGKMVLILAVFYNGTSEKGEKLATFLKGFGDPVGDHIGMQPYTRWQQAFDPLLTPGMRNYWKSHNFREIKDELIETVIKHAGNIPTPHTEIFLGSISGVQNTIPADATAYSARDARYIVNVHGRWEKPEDDKKCISWSRQFYEATKPYASGGAYVN